MQDCHPQPQNTLNTREHKFEAQYTREIVEVIKLRPTMETKKQLLLIKSIGIRVNLIKFCLDHLQFIHMPHARLNNQYRARNIKNHLTIVREKAQEFKRLF